MKTELRTLLIEDSEIDAQLILRELRAGGFTVAARRVETEEDLAAALRAQSWDLVVCDHKLPRFDAPAALKMVRESGQDLPFVVVSGNISPDLAVEMMRQGAHDYLTKTDLTRFVPAVRRELAEAGKRAELGKAEEGLRQAERALHQSEVRYREIFQTATDLVMSVDVAESGRFLLAEWNRSCCRKFGLPEADGARKPISEILPISVLPELEQLLGSCLSTGEALSADQHLVMDGEETVLGTQLHPVKDAQGRICRIIVVSRDITHRKQGEEALRKAHDELDRRVRERTAELTAANNRLRELDKLKSEFLATMSHELRTPLNSIIGFTSLVKEGITGPLNDEQRKQLGMVYSASKHLLGLINDLLDVSRIEAGKISLNADAFDFAGVVAETVAQMKPLALAKRLAIRPQLPAGALPLLGDRRRCLQIMLNLVQNAVKFTEKGTIDIVVRTEAQHLRIDVIDTGIGIKPEFLDSIFEAFRQADGSAKRTHDGTGLGLYLCRKLLVLMNGTLTVHSVVGQGSRFSFTVPRQLPKDNAGSAASQPGKNPAAPLSATP